MYGLLFVGEKSSKIKSASKNSGDNQADSVWTVITNIAGNSQYVVFVADGTLYFGSEKWLNENLVHKDVQPYVQSSHVIMMNHYKMI